MPAARQLIPILSGTLTGAPEGRYPELRGTVLPGGVDSQVIRPDGRCELSARYGVGCWKAVNGTVPPSTSRTMVFGPYRRSMSRR